MSNSRNHVLVVGGTGMLRAVSLTLAERGHDVSVIARNTARLQMLTQQAINLAGDIHPLPVDYRDSDALLETLTAAVSRRSRFDMAVVWVHAVAPEAPYIIAQHTGKPNEPARYIHVLGSAAADPSKPDHHRKRRFDAIESIAYCEVILGFVRTDHGSRWLTHTEISQGVLHAIDMNLTYHIIGTVNPWSARP